MIMSEHTSIICSQCLGEVCSLQNVNSKSGCSFEWTENWDVIRAGAKTILCKVSHPLLNYAHWLFIFSNECKNTGIISFYVQVYRLCFAPPKNSNTLLISIKVPPEEAMNQLFTHNRTLEEKIDEILDIVKAQTVKTGLDLNELQNENKELRLHMQVSDAIIAKLSRKVVNLEGKLLSMEMHSMKKNIILYNVPETDNKSTYDVAINFLSSSLNILPDLLFSKTNPGGEVRVDIAHRIGQRGPKPRPVVVAFVTQHTRNTVLDHGKFLKSSPFCISEQLPAVVHERRNAQVPLLKEMHNEARQNDSKQNIKLVKDKLLIDSKVKCDVFESKPLEYITGSSVSIKNENIQHSSSLTVKKSVFQGHFYPAPTEEEGKSVL